MQKGELTLRMGNEAVHFNLNKSLTQPDVDAEIYMAVENSSPISFDLISDCNLQYSINENEMNFQYLESVDYELLQSSLQNIETFLILNENSQENSSCQKEKVTKLETSSEGLILKDLPSHLKYAFLEPKKGKPVIVSAKLTENEEQRLLQILRKYKEAIAWPIKDLKSISLSICMHKILLNDDEKTSIEHQRRLNPMMQDVVRKEVLKWINVGFIYAISDSPWVSPVHVVPKKGGFTMIRNERNELIPTRIVTG